MTRSVFSTEYRDLCRLLIQARKSRGLTQKQVAKRPGRPQSFVSKYENADRRLDVIEFMEVASALGVEAESFLASVRGKRRTRKQQR